MVCFLRYAQVIEHSHRCWVNTSALVSGCTNAIGLVMVGNFQVSKERNVMIGRYHKPVLFTIETHLMFKMRKCTTFKKKPIFAHLNVAHKSALVFFHDSL